MNLDYVICKDFERLAIICLLFYNVLCYGVMKASNESLTYPITFCLFD